MGSSKSNERIKKIVTIGLVTTGCFIGGILVSNFNSDRREIVDNAPSTQGNTISEEEKPESFSQSYTEETTVVENNINIEPIPQQTYAIDRIEIQKITDKITEKDERKQYEIKTLNSGLYRFELSDVPQNIQFTMYVYNAGMEQLAKEYDRYNGRGITINLDANSTYYVVIEQEDNVGSFVLNIGTPKGTQDVSNYNIISDSIQYCDQENIYFFTTGEKGTYRFELSDVPQNIQFTMYVYNSNMEQLAKEYDRQNGKGITINLAETSNYFVVVKQEDNVGSYKLNIGCQKPIIDISDRNCVSDSIQYTSQSNIYQYTPKVSGQYSIRLFNVPNNTQFTLYVYNSNWEQLTKEYDRTNDRILSCKMEKDSLYYIVVQQEDYTGVYSLACEIDEN